MVTMSIDLTQNERILAQQLQALPSEFRNRWSEDAKRRLLSSLFHSLANQDLNYLHYFFPEGPPKSQSESWSLSEAQGAQEGAEYSEAARGKRCGHIFQEYEATYTCKTCSTDDTCVLCAKCFEASDHAGHQVSVHLSQGASGCCDCGDDEAWIKPVHCSIHSLLPGEDPPTQGKGKGKATMPVLPDELEGSIRSTVARALDYVCDVFSCAPEHVRLPKEKTAIRHNEERSRLKGTWYNARDSVERCDEFSLVLWNDEKHTFPEVVDQLARACRMNKQKAEQLAREVDEHGRTVVENSRDLDQLLKRAIILEQIKITVTVRSSRDTFREEMCGAIVEWLYDIAGCTCGPDGSILMNVICEEMLKPWRMGSSAYNIRAGKRILDEAKNQHRLQELALKRMRAQALAEARAARRLANRARDATDEGPPPRNEVTANATPNTEEADDNDEDEDMENATDEMDLDMDVEATLAHDDVDMVAEAVDDMTGVIFEEQAFLDVIGDAFGTSPPLSVSHHSEDISEEETANFARHSHPDQLISAIPQTPRAAPLKHTRPAPDYWMRSAKNDDPDQPVEIYENLEKRVRIDYMILYDLRMWKNLRNDFRNLYISTVIKVPYFKRVLGLRFSAVYTHLAQLYLIADREPESSIINLSLQMLTTPSITGEIVERGDFFTKLLAILYTFLTKRQVGFAQDVDPDADAALEVGTMVNRRIAHFFGDMRYLLESKHVQEMIRTREELLLQFLDFIKLYQGICPNVRAVGEHIEYESDAWMTATYIVREVTKMSPRFCDAFAWTKDQDPTAICRAIRETARATIINSLGCEHERFAQAELKKPVLFKEVNPYSMEHFVNEKRPPHTVIHFEVENSSMSFHHVLHYTLSWLIENGRSMTVEQLRALLTFTSSQLQSRDWKATSGTQAVPFESNNFMTALFDMPLRVCAWLSQIRAGMWVRNGISLRHQMAGYRSVGQRDNSAQRDLFLLQVASVVCPREEFLANMIDRFGMTSWMRGELNIKDGWEDHQMMDVFEDFLHTLITILSDRTLLISQDDEPNQRALVIKREISRTLCFRPLSHSELSERMSSNISEFPEILRECATYRPPDGLQDSGTFELKDQYFDEIDPFDSYYNKNAREEADNIWRSRMAKRSGVKPEDIVYEPHLRPIRSGVFTELGEFSQTALFAQVIAQSISLAQRITQQHPGIPESRVDALLPVLLHLMLIAIADDKTPESLTPNGNSFCDLFFHGVFTKPLSFENGTICGILITLLGQAKHEASKPRMRLALRRFQEKRPILFNQVVEKYPHILTPDFLDPNINMSAKDSAEKKKRLAKERQAQVLAGFKLQQNAFMENNAIDWGVEDESALEDGLNEEAKKTWSFPEGTCIVCQEETSMSERLFGTPAYIMESTIYRQTDLGSKDWVQELGMVPDNLDRNADAFRPFGVAGSTEPITVSAREESSNHKSYTLGKGFPASHNRSGPIATGCGHVIHYHCFQSYMTSTSRRQQMQITRDHPERITLMEFLCPLCKAIGNAFLPIIWKSKEYISPQSIGTTSFEGWLTAQMPYLVSRVTDPAQYQKLALTYANENVTSAVISKFIPKDRSAASPSTVTSRPTNPPMWQNFAALHTRRPRTTSMGSFQAVTASRERSDGSTDLVDAYKRLNDTFKYNKFISRHHYNSEETLCQTDTLAKTLGHSVAATEIAYRGAGPTRDVSEPNSAFIMGTIPAQVITQLKVLSESCSSYVAASLVNNRLDTQEILQISVGQVQALMGPNLQLGSHLERTSATQASLLEQDTFIFFADCTIYMIPNLRLDMHCVLRLCYLAEIVKVVVAFFQNGKAAHECAKLYANSGSPSTKKHNRTDIEHFTSFVQEVLHEFKASRKMTTNTVSEPWLDENPNNRFFFDEFLYTAASSYALTFLRKITLLLSVRYNIDFSTSSAQIDNDLPELLRLTQLLKLPTINSLTEAAMSTTPSGNATYRIVSHWIRHYFNKHPSLHDFVGHSVTSSVPPLLLPHPGIFELVPLPVAHDILNTAVLSARCPSTGGPLSEPTVCLLCGALLCGQSTCCYVRQPTGQTFGACFRHQRTCGGSIGVFLNIRKCAVVLLNGMHGCFQYAPYLDENGEVDFNLKRKGRLWLNTKRLDKGIRELWIRGGVPAQVARKSEGEVGIGGWETM